MGMFFWQQKQYEHALPHFRQAYEMRKKLLGSDHFDTRNSLRMLCQTFIELGHKAAALAYCDESLRIAQKYATQTWENHFASCLRGAALSGTGEYQVAEKLLRNGYAGLLESIDEIPPISREATRAFVARQIVALYETTGDAAQAETWRGEFTPRE